MQLSLSAADILESLQEPLAITDESGCLMYFSRAFAAAVLDVGATEVRGGSPLGRYLPGVEPLIHRCLLDEAAQRAVLPGRAWEFQVGPLKKQGELVGTVCRLRRLAREDQAGGTVHRCLQEDFKTIFDTSSDGIWVTDGEGTVLAINRASERLCDIRAEEVIGRKTTELTSEGLFDRSVAAEVLVSRRQVSLVQYLSKTKKYILVTGTPVFAADGSISLVVVNERDITALNELRAELEHNRLVTEGYRDELSQLNLLELQRQEIVAESDQMRQVLRIALKLARLEASNILILGESGTGKGLVARFIHQHSSRSQQPFIQINCAAVPESLLEAELFGYEKGAFTGARHQGKVGLFELAHKGTLFLDEIGDLPVTVQAKLLKYLDDQEILRLGGVRARKVECTVVAATNRDLQSLVDQGLFRKDLYFRLNSFTIRIPPLRDRPEDLFGLVTHFLAKYTKKYKAPKKLGQRGLDLLHSYGFPGNVRELDNLVKKAVVMSEEEFLDDFIARSLGGTGAEIYAERKGEEVDLNAELQAVEKAILKRAQQRCRSTREMAEFLGISQPTVVRKLRRYGLS